MNNKPKVSSLEQLLDRICDAADSEDNRVSLANILDAVGRRSFGPLLLLAGLITLAPLIGDIPGMPTIMGLIVLITAGQMLFNRKHFWLPGWLLERKLPQDKLRRAIGWLRRPSRFLDRWTGPRLASMVEGIWLYIIAGFCILIALLMPVMELVPFSANGAGIALTILGLALIAKDGLLVLIALIVTVFSAIVVFINLL